MKRIKKSSKLGNHYLRLYRNAKATSVKQFYKKASPTKLYIEQVLLWKIEREQGKYYKVIGGNSYSFTAAWIATDGLCVKTPHNTYLIC